MRFLRCDVMVEEELRPDRQCKEDLDILKVLKGVTRKRVRRLTFFRSLDHSATSGVFAHDRANAFAQADRDAARLKSLLKTGKALQCLGYVYLHTDLRDNYPQHCYVHSAVVCGPEAALDLRNRARRRLTADETLSTHWFPHSQAVFNSQVLGEPISVPGCFFAQQQSIITCCAHVAAMVVLRNLYGSLGMTCPVSYGDMNRLLSIDHQSRLAPTGLRPNEIARILEDLGHLSTVVLQSNELAPEEVITAAYHTIESGLPAILCFEGVGCGHAMAAIGHTFEPGLWPGARAGVYFEGRRYPYLSSHAWATSLIVQDDNFGPYCILPKHSLVDRNPAVILPTFPWVDSVRPEFPEIFARRVLSKQFIVQSRRHFNRKQTLFESILKSDAKPAKTSRWFYEVLDHIAAGTCILRTIPCTWPRYEQFLKRNNILSGVEEVISGVADKCRKGPFWLVEISIPDLFQWNANRLGEIIVHGDATDPGTGPATLVRLPGVLTMLYQGGYAEHYSISGDAYYPIERRQRGYLGPLLVSPWSR